MDGPTSGSTIASSIAKDVEKASADLKTADSKARVYKNLIVVGLMMLLSYSSTNPTLTLVTSIAGKTLGNITFCLNYFFTCLFIFASISVLNNGVSKKKVMITGNVCLIGFAVCNWYVSYYTLIPGTVLFGCGASITTISSLMYTSKIAVDHAKRWNLVDKSVASFFTGIVIALASGGYLLGSASTASVLTLLEPKEDYHNDTDSMDQNFTNSDGECYTNDDKLEFNFVTVNVLRGLIVFYSILALAVLVFLDEIDEAPSQTAGTCRLQLLTNFVKNQWQDLVTMAKVVNKKETVSSCLLCFVVGASVSFMFTRFTKTYVAECLGVHVVGYAIMLYGIGGTLGSFVSGKLLALKTERLLVLGNLFIHLIIILFLVNWDREPITVLLLFISLVWGTCDGSWITIFNSFAATYFEGEKTRYSFAIQWIVYQFGMASNAILSLVMPVEVNLIIIGAMYLVFVPLYLVVIYCSKPLVHKVYETPVFFVDEC